jgi:hypothetical protein
LMRPVPLPWRVPDPPPAARAEDPPPPSIRPRPTSPASGELG